MFAKYSVAISLILALTLLLIATFLYPGGIGWLLGLEYGTTKEDFNN